MTMKGDHRTLVRQSLLGEAAGVDLIVEADPSASLAHDVVAVTDFDYLNKQNFTLLLCRSSIVAVFGPSIGQVYCEILPRSADQDYPVQRNLPNMIQFLEGVSRHSISV
jgi:hypothetical protein